MDRLNDILDPQGQSFEAIGRWVDARIAAINATDFTPDITATFAPIELTEKFEHEFGAEASADWRRFFIATLLADWACYERPIDRVDFPRLKYIMSSSSQYFRLWGCRLRDGKITPVGYSAWYPIPRYVYEGSLSHNESIDDRGAFMPQRFVQPQDIRYGYVFNVSIIKQLRNTPFSRRIIKAVQADGARHGDINFMAVTVDEAGRKFSRMSKFDHHGNITVQGETEGLFVRPADMHSGDETITPFQKLKP